MPIAIGIIALPVLTPARSSGHGVAVSKPAGPRSRRLLLAVLGVLVAAMLSSLAVKFLDLEPWWALLPAAITFAATVALGRRYDATLRDEIASPVCPRP